MVSAVRGSILLHSVVDKVNLGNTWAWKKIEQKKSKLIWEGTTFPISIFWHTLHWQHCDWMSDWMVFCSLLWSKALHRTPKQKAMVPHAPGAGRKPRRAPEARSCCSSRLAGAKCSKMVWDKSPNMAADGCPAWPRNRASTSLREVSTSALREKQSQNIPPSLQNS